MSPILLFFQNSLGNDHQLHKQAQNRYKAQKFQINYSDLAALN